MNDRNGILIVSILALLLILDIAYEYWKHRVDSSEVSKADMKQIHADLDRLECSDDCP